MNWAQDWILRPRLKTRWNSHQICLATSDIASHSGKTGPKKSELTTITHPCPTDPTPATPPRDQPEQPARESAFQHRRRRWPVCSFPQWACSWSVHGFGPPASGSRRSGRANEWSSCSWPHLQALREDEHAQVVQLSVSERMSRPLWRTLRAVNNAAERLQNP